MVLSLLLTYIFCVEFAEVDNVLPTVRLSTYYAALVVQAIKMYIMHVLYPHKSVRDAKRGPRTARNSPSVSGNILNNRDSTSVPPPVPVLSQANSHSLKELSDICCLCARTIDHPIPLPNVLILGPPGTVGHKQLLMISVEYMYGRRGKRCVQRRSQSNRVSLT